MHKLCLDREEFWYKGLQLEQVNTGERGETPCILQKGGASGVARPIHGAQGKEKPMTGWCGLSRGPALGASLAPQTTSGPMSKPAPPGVESAQCGWHLLGAWRPHASLAVKQGL